MHSQEQGLESAQRYTQGWTVGRVSTPLCRQPRTKLNYTLGAGDCQSQDVCTHTVCVCARAHRCVCMRMYTCTGILEGRVDKVGGRQGGGRHQLSWTQTQSRHVISPHPHRMAREPAASCRRQGAKRLTND